MEEKFQLVFTKADLEVLDCALWFYQRRCVFQELDLNKEHVDNFVNHFSHIIDLRNYVRRNFIDEE